MVGLAPADSAWLVVVRTQLRRWSATFSPRYGSALGTCPTLGSGRVTYGGLHDQNPHRNVAVLVSGRLCHRDRDCGCQLDHLRTPEGNNKGPAAKRRALFHGA
jgi:hypothetical protein